MIGKIPNALSTSFIDSLTYQTVSIQLTRTVAGNLFAEDMEIPHCQLKHRSDQTS